MTIQVGYHGTDCDESNDYNSFLQFTRPRNTNNQNDLPFSDTTCRYLIYARGPLTNNKNSIRKHDKTPAVSGRKVGKVAYQLL